MADRTKDKPPGTAENGLLLPLSYIYAEAQDWERYLQACDALMWMQSTLLSQICNSHFAVKWKTYAAFAEAGAKARGLSTEAFFDVCLDWKTDLPTYVEKPPEYRDAPLAGYFDPHNSDQQPPAENKKTRRSINHLRIGTANAALLRVVCDVHNVSLRTIAGILLKSHLDSYWEKSYASQIRAAEQKSFHRIINPTN